MTHHPAPYSAPVVELLRRLLSEHQGRINALDPFAGVGRGLAAFPPKAKVTLVEIEKEWADECRLVAEWASHLDVAVVHGDSRKDIPRRKYTHIIFSPAYGNRMADPFRSKPGTRCRSYAQSLGRNLDEANGGKYDFTGAPSTSSDYMWLHHDVMVEATKRLSPGGEVWINVSNYYKTLVKGHPPRLINVTAWWITMMAQLGFTLKAAHPIETRRFKEGENRHRVTFESLLIFADARTPPVVERKAVGRQKR